MNRIPPRTRHRALATAVALVGAPLLMALAPADASATTQTRSVHLRVEGATGTLERGRGYVAGTVRTRRAVGPNPDCVNRAGRPRFPGITPIGALGLAGPHNRRLRPLRMRLTNVGWQLCQVGKGQAQKSFGTDAGDFGGWLYRVNHRPGFSAMDERTLRLGDELLVYYAVFPAAGSSLEPLNNGRELVLRRVPARVRPGKPFTVRAVAYGEDGNAEPVSGGEGIEVRGGEAAVQPDAKGFAEVTIGESGTSRLGAVDTAATPGEFGPEHDIASERLAICARGRVSRCSPRRATRILGSPRGDRIRATRGDDLIRAGAGPDVIDLRPGGRNRVLCGPGNDRVIVKPSTRRTLRGCERVNRK